MKTGIVADTYLYNRAAALPRTVLDIFRGVDHIFHAGDTIHRALTCFAGKGSLLRVCRGCIAIQSGAAHGQEEKCL